MENRIFHTTILTSIVFDSVILEILLHHWTLIRRYQLMEKFSWCYPNFRVFFDTLMSFYFFFEIFNKEP